MKAYYSRNTDHWATPKKMYDKFMELGYIDPCPLHCDCDNLGKRFVNSKLYINPPFSKLKEWVDYIIDLYKLGNEIILLMPARTDTKYFHKLIEQTQPQIIFIKGRVKFNDCKTGAPFPTILVSIHNECNLPLFSLLEMDI